MKTRIGVVGSSMVDLVTSIDRMPAPGETLEARSFSIGQGGKGANQAVAAARLGGDAVLVARVGDDVLGSGTIHNLAAAGVDVREVRVIPGAQSGVASVFVDPSGENRILIVKGANDRLLPADVDAAADVLEACSLILVQLEIPLETVYHTIDWARRRGIDVLLNPAPATPGLDVQRVLGVSFLVPNQTELAILTGQPAQTRTEAEAAARSLVARGLRTVIVTLGAEGALLVEDGPAVHVPSIPVRPHDTSGAGDAFIGAFAQRYVETRNALASMHWGSRYAADSITRPGTQAAFGDAEMFAAFCHGVGEA